VARRGPARALCLIALVAALMGAGPSDLDYLTTTIGPRPDASAAGERANRWLFTQLAGLRAPVEQDVVGFVDLPAIRVMGVTYREAHVREAKQPNLYLRLGGNRGKALLIMAHVDSVAGSPGAVDNAASVAILLELARELDAHPPAQPVILAFTAAEEDGLVGAESLAAELADEVSFAIALDLVGGEGELVVNGASTLVGQRELEWLLDAAEHAGVELDVPAVHRVISRAWPQAERSDHAPFTRRGVRAVHFYNRGNDGEWVDLAYHSEGDVASRVRPERVAEVSRLLRALVERRPPEHGTDGFVVPVVRAVVPRWTLVAVEVLLALVALGVLARALLGYVTRTRETVRGASLLAASGCYAAAVAAAVPCVSSVWILRPLPAVAGSALVIAGVTGLLSRAVTRIAPWRGEARFLAVAITVPLGVGLALLALGAAELAWVWLVPAALLAIASSVRVLTWLAVLASLLPAVLTLHPLRLREAAWNGFLPSQLPLALVVGVFGMSTAAAVAWALRRRPAAGPLGPLALGLGCALLVIAGVVVAVTAPTPCSMLNFMKFSLACERV